MSHAPSFCPKSLGQNQGISQTRSPGVLERAPPVNDRRSSDGTRERELLRVRAFRCLAWTQLRRVCSVSASQPARPHLLPRRRACWRSTRGHAVMSGQRRATGVGRGGQREREEEGNGRGKRRAMGVGMAGIERTKIRRER